VALKWAWVRLSRLIDNGVLLQTGLGGSAKSVPDGSGVTSPLFMSIKPSFTSELTSFWLFLLPLVELTAEYFLGDRPLAAHFLVSPPL
jgi:hypothetical protein